MTFLSAVWTIILTAPIHCRWFTGELSYEMLHFSKSVLMKKQTLLNIIVAWKWIIFCPNFGWTAPFRILNKEVVWSKSCIAPCLHCISDAMKVFYSTVYEIRAQWRIIWVLGLLDFLFHCLYSGVLTVLYCWQHCFLMKTPSFTSTIIYPTGPLFPKGLRRQNTKASQISISKNGVKTSRGTLCYFNSVWLNKWPRWCLEAYFVRYSQWRLAILQFLCFNKFCYANRLAVVSQQLIHGTKLSRVGICENYLDRNDLNSK